MNTYGNGTLPGITQGKTFRPNGSIFRGPVAKDFYKVVVPTGSDDDAIPEGTVLKETADGWAVLEIADFSTTTVGSGQDEVTVPAVIDSARLGIVVDRSAVIGENATVLIGLRGEADQEQLLVGDTAWADLSDANKSLLTLKFATWGIDLIPVVQG